MPYFIDDTLQDKDKDPSQVQISGASPTTDSSGNVTQSQNNKRDINTGSGYQNLDKYLSTNESQNFGNQVLGKVEGEVEGAKQNQTDASQAFTNKVNTSNYVPTSEQVNQALANPTGANPSDFQKWQSQAYAGPKSLGESQGDWNQYWSGTNKANTSASLLGSEPGRFTLLDSYFGKPSYNYGQKSLDNLLVQQSGLGKETKDVQNQAAQLKSQGAEQAKNLQGAASTRAGQVEQSRNQVNQSFNDAQTQAQQNVENTFQQAQAARAGEQAAIKASLGQGQVSRDQLAKIGLGEGQSLYNLDLNKYLTANGGLTKEQAATDDERTRLNALAQLAGIGQNYLGDKQDLSSAYGFDSGRYAADAAAVKSQIDQLQPKFNNDAIYAALNVGNSQFRNLLPSDNQAQNINYLKQQATDYSQLVNSDALTNGSGTTQAQMNSWRARLNAINGVLNSYNQYNALNTGRRLGVR